jgi:hypothetical protein
MNPRSAAALALVGWYLMISPADQPDTPLTSWRIDESFDNAQDDCRNAQVEGVGGDLWNYDRPPFPRQRSSRMETSTVSVHRNR